MGSPLRVRAPAKVNLALRVGAVRSDGFHEIDTLLQAIDLADELEIEATGEGIALDVRGEDAGPVEHNLVLRAVRAFAAAADIEVPALRIRLRKRVPAGAGLGGGSADAAAALRALARLLPGRLDRETLVRIGARLGSDVPFFLGSSPLARGRGRGERLEPLAPLPPLPGIVVMPEARMSTARAYAALDWYRAAGEGAGSAPAWTPPADWEAVAREAVNDFEEMVADELPEVGRALEALPETRPLVALLSGSGAACFALYRGEGEATRAAEQLERAAVGRIHRFRTLARWPEAPHGAA